MPKPQEAKADGARWYNSSWLYRKKLTFNTTQSEKMYANQQHLFFKLLQQNVKIILGQLIQHRDKSYHEKGVDVRIAVEMIRLARQDKFDIAYLLSSDTDLVPAVEEVLSLNKVVKYVGTADSQSFGLSKVTGNYLILRPEDIEPFFPEPFKIESINLWIFKKTP